MNTGQPPLNENEGVLFDHIPSHRVFAKIAALALLTSLVPTVIFSIVWPDTVAAVVPLVLTCVLLMQERLTLGRYRAWITNQRVILQGGRDVPLWDVLAEPARGYGVRLDGAGIRLAYVADQRKVINVIETAQRSPK